MIRWLAIGVAAIGLLVFASVDNNGLESDDDRIRRLAESYACPVCDGESVADSSAAVAATIRSFIAEAVTDGATDTEVRDELVAAYGQEVLLNPPGDGFASLVWVLPVLVLGLGGAGLVLYIRASADPDAAGESSADSSQPSVPSRGWLMVGGVALLAVLAGFGLARFSGERGINGQITGEIDRSTRGQVLECQQQGADGDLLGAVQCFDEVLVTNPDNTEALTYRGWYLTLASSSLPDGPERQAAQESGLDSVSRALEIDPGYPDGYAFRAVIMDRLGDGEAVCADLSSLDDLNPPPFFEQQTARLAEAHNC